MRMWNAQVWNVHVWNAHVQTKTQISKPQQKAWHCKYVRNVMWSLKSKQNQNNAMNQNQKGIPVT